MDLLEKLKKDCPQLSEEKIKKIIRDSERKVQKDENL
ncbi:hypothetical protein SAMN04515654_12147 [Halanaerobium congolense]|uniref:Uncharacterized protein n=1 Tax=Halanaerobium congolense TaxID=54121 RepID=A0A1G8PWJ4_9FIRM|nr:hypothetical protein SAMN04515654_12147 [Halanaerobium congolense]SES91271.1 hypothetical protein SAMN04515653_10447 [Halanaerobium congolense]